MLGHFHMLLSFLGSIGYIMASSGLKEVLSTIYAANSVDQILNGHNYSRGMRAHHIVCTALAKVIFDELEEKDENLKTIIDDMELQCLLCNLTEKTINIDDIPKLKAFTDFINLLEKKLVDLKNHGPTARLWLTYMRMNNIVNKCQAAEKKWEIGELHLEVVQEMIPFFHSSGHHLYAKCAQMYLQDISS